MDGHRFIQEDISLSEAMWGYNISIHGKTVGGIEAVPGRLEYLVVYMDWEGKGMVRVAVKEFIDLSREHGLSEVTTNNAVHPAMEQILETEGFKQELDEGGWLKEI